MHMCPSCHQTCYCDMEDHENEAAADECVHECEEELSAYEEDYA